MLRIRSSFRFASDRIVMRLKYSVNERNDFTANLSLATGIVIARKEAEKAASVLSFGISIPLLPTLPRSRGNSRACVHRLRLFIVVVEFRVNDAITEESGSNINITGALEKFSTFRRNARGSLRRKQHRACISFLNAPLSGRAGQSSSWTDRRMP